MRAHPLSSLDLQSHMRNYGRYITIFPFPYPHRADAVYRALCTRLTATLKKFPFSTKQRRKKGWMKEACRILNAEFVNMVMGMGHEELSAKFFDPSLLIPSFLQYHHGLDPNDSYATSPTPFYQNTPLPVVAT
ncbi:hypothetical protein HBH56_217330 [Parastagonospora nodorum]|uniref:Uncharacterized protein n=1 Tax=Phaeosphaeria nodorum (strain SN15 / ATCC MYA-4574 / FGSC 10173) TaxID=321614 RepID=A0A7U2I916_PHANO|nr:hypothetical protein HBH56_217330 [Parastagonospora nodorum]QRD05484.1 hypothetical protein JI435_444470 [Parastagonospora nodorum SN15]KAH3922738.1 hypothetical protein HBH54_219190 [Parastagonospora nodorum]KAH4043608.1 hypothetical protein HBH49_228900 [Parastagonospora nodorum]KAH4132192.1 hypothetical protein HBH45_183980 [Parastagonospora nodorum]